MDNHQDRGSNFNSKPAVLQPEEVSHNNNTRANENIRERTAEPRTQEDSSTEGVGSEIIDGEDA